MKNNRREKSLSLRSVFNLCLRHFTLAILTTIFLSGCGNGGGGGGNTQAPQSTQSSSSVIAAQAVGLEKLMITYNVAPAVGQEVVVSASSTGVLSAVSWELTSQPQGSNISITPSSDTKSATLTPTLAGEYVIRIKTSVDGVPAERETIFFAALRFAYDLSKVEKTDPNTDPGTVVGIVKNQIYVFSVSKNEEELHTILSKYPRLSVLGYDSLLGMLIQFDETDLNALEDLKSLKLEAGIDSVYYRFHRGGQTIQFPLIPDDGSEFKSNGVDWFNLIGGNWHLEQLGAVSAWNFTTGSSKVQIGVVDSMFYPNHEDLAGRFSDLYGNQPLTPQEESSTDPNWAVIKEHGDMSASTIAANTNNGIGISGINWKSKIVGAAWRPGLKDDYSARLKEGLHNVLISQQSGTSTKVVNLSVYLVSTIPADFDSTDPNAVAVVDRFKKQLAGTRDIRALAERYQDKLFIISAGNGNNNGGSENGQYGQDAIYDNGAIHLDDSGALAKLDNVIVVAAIGEQNRLAGYSDYGDTVDIAAYTGFWTAGEVAGNVSKYFTGSGTSVAAPVVSGVASLIYSLYPDFTGKEVREILIESAKEYVTKHYYCVGFDAITKKCIVKDYKALPDGSRIPIVNLEAAILKAKEKLAAKGLFYSLHVSIGGTGSGTVDASGITCPEDCDELFSARDGVVVTAWPISGSEFAGWQGCPDPSGNFCLVSMNSDKTVTAIFNLAKSSPPATFSLDVTISGTGSGVITGSGITCPGDCFEPFASGTNTTLTAIADINSTFIGWLGCTSSVGAICNVSMGANASVTAVFNAQLLPDPIPASPSNLVATALSQNNVSLVWQDNSGNETGFKIERKTGANGTFAQIATAGSGSGSGGYYEDTGLTAGTNYCYRLRAYNTAGDSSYTSESCVTTQAVGTAPSAPTGVSTAAGNGQVTVSWNATAGVTYNLYMASISGVTKSTYSGLPDGMKHSGVTSPYVHTGLTNGTTYYFVVTAVNANGESNESSQVSAMPQISSAISGPVRTIDYNGPGNDGIWFTGDDAVERYSSNTYDASGYLIESIDYIGAGNDGVWFTADDTVISHFLQTNDSNGEPVRIVHYNAGADGKWLTPDDAIGVYASITYDAGGNINKSVLYYSAGVDGIWFTADDPISAYSYGTSDAGGNLIRMVSVGGVIINNNGVLFTGAGNDGIWFTVDDLITDYSSLSYDAKGNIIQSVFYNSAGSDGIWLTADDLLVDMYFSYTYDAQGNWTRSVSYSGPGIDGIRYTADDPINTYSSYTYDALGNETRSVTYSNPGSDGVWFTADDVVSRYTSSVY